MTNGDSAKGRVRGLIGKITNIGLIVLGFVSVFLTSQAKNQAADTHEDMYGAKIAHADVPVADSSLSSASSAVVDSSSGGCGSGGCSGGSGGSSGGDGGGASGCGCGSY